jgi:hypothetical protein
MTEYQCEECAHVQEKDGPCGNCGQFGLVPRIGSGVDPVSGLDAATFRLLHAIELVTREHGLARAQRALACALWRKTASHPSLQMSVDFDLCRIVLADGGRAVRLELETFPALRIAARSEAKLPAGPFDGPPFDPIGGDDHE